METNVYNINVPGCDSKLNAYGLFPVYIEYVFIRLND